MEENKCCINETVGIFSKKFRRKCYYSLHFLYLILRILPSLLITFFCIGIYKPKKKSERKHLLLVTDYNIRMKGMTDKASELWCEGLSEQHWLESVRMSVSSVRELIGISLYIKRKQPDIVCYSPSGKTYFSSPFWRLLKFLKVNVFFLITDSSAAVEQHIRECWGNSASGVVIDMPTSVMDPEWENLKHFTFLFSPFSQKIYYDSGAERCINCSFIGEIDNGYPQRRETVEMMKKRNVPFFTTGGDSAPVTKDEMVDIYQHSKIVIDFAETAAGHYQLKGRVIEAMLCGAVVMTRRTAAIDCYLSPGEDYIPYENIQEIPDLVEFFLAAPEKLERIRKKGSETAVKIFNPVFFWEKVWEWGRKSSFRCHEDKAVQAVILAGGLGTRLKKVVCDRQKVVAEVAGKPFVWYILRQLNAAGVKSVIICVGHKSETVREALQGSFPEMEILFSLEEYPCGTAGAVSLALRKCSRGELLILNGDSYLDADLNKFLEHWRTSRVPVCMMLKKMNDSSRYGRVSFNSEGIITAFEEKKENAGAGYINAGIYACKRKFLAAKLTSEKGSLEKEYFPRFAAEALLAGFVDEGEFIDIGTPESYAAAQHFFEKGPLK